VADLSNDGFFVYLADDWVQDFLDDVLFADFSDHWLNVTLNVLLTNNLGDDLTLTNFVGGTGLTGDDWGSLNVKLGKSQSLGLKVSVSNLLIAGGISLALDKGVLVDVLDNVLLFKFNDLLFVNLLNDWLVDNFNVLLLNNVSKDCLVDDVCYNCVLVDDVGGLGDNWGDDWGDTSGCCSNSGLCGLSDWDGSLFKIVVV